MLVFFSQLLLYSCIIKSTAYSNALSTAPLMYLILLVSQIKPIENSQIISVFSLQLFLAWIYVLLKKGWSTKWVITIWGQEIKYFSVD